MTRIVAQFSCGAASAVATKIVLSQHKGAEIIIANAFVKEEDEDKRQELIGLPVDVQMSLEGFTNA